MPNYTVRIVCLANSRKMSGRCIAGKAWERGRAGAWIRPVSARESHEISERDRGYEDGSGPQLLDIIDIPCKSPAPQQHQSENHLIDDGYYWAKVGSVTWADAARMVDSPASLWNPGFSSGTGSHDRVPINEPILGSGSLTLIRADEVSVQVVRVGLAGGDAKRTVRAKFGYHGIDYDLRVTDPQVERTFLRQGEGSYAVGEALLCVSLGEPFSGHYYKLVAAMLTRNPAV